MLVGLVACVVCAWQFGDRVVGLLDPMPRMSTADLPRPAASAPTVREAQTLPQRRPVYPYSVISGGVDSADELRIAMRFDPVVAAHYADFDLFRTRVERVTASRAVYVSFRSGDRVAWTTRRLTLKPGETILTDGRNSARTRCGNRIADVPPATDAAEEPEPEVLDTPLPPAPLPLDLLAGFDTLVGLGEIPVPRENGDIVTPPALPPLLAPPDLPEPSVLQFPPLFWTPPGLILGPIPDDQQPPSNPEPAPIPEPGTLLLLSPALAVFAWVRRSRRRRQSSGSELADSASAVHRLRAQ